MGELMQVFFQVIREEFQALWQNKRNLIVLLGSPIFFLTIFGYMYSSHVVTGVKTVVLDLDNSSLSRTVLDNIGNSEKFKVIGQVDSEAGLKAAVESGQADVAVVIPHDFNRDIKKQHSSQVLIIVNGSNMMISNTIVTSASEIIQTLSAGAGIKVMEGKGFLPNQALNTVGEISYRYRVWYNPTYNYANFLLLGLMGTAVQQVILLFTAISVVVGRVSGALAGKKRFRDLTVYITGKLVPYVLINLLSLNLVILELTAVYQVPFRGSPGTLLLLEVVFVLCVCALGVFLSSICQDQLQATQLAMLVAVPSFLMSGYTWPLESMPALVRGISHLLPLTYFVNALRKLALMGVGLATIKTDIFILGGAALVFVPLSILVLRLQMEYRARQNHRGVLDV